MKKRGFGQGRWNGFGGKVAEGEDIVSAAKRELLEECGIIAEELEEAGVLEFEFPNESNFIQVNIFRVTKYSGSLFESEEMMPKWFDIAEIPFSEMWPDDQFWLPLFLEGKKVKGKFIFEGMDKIIGHELSGS